MMYGRGLGYRAYGNTMMSGGGWFAGLLFVLFALLVLAAIVLLVIWAVRASSRHGHTAMAVPPNGPAPSTPNGHDEAVAIAKRRLALGEITPEQYAEIMRHLGA